MGFGSFKQFFCLLLFVTGIHAGTAQTTPDFIYQTLDEFLKAPSPTTLFELQKKTANTTEVLTTAKDHLAWVILKCNMGYYYQQFGEIATAILQYEKAWEVYKNHQLTDYDIIENCLQPLGNSYLKIGDLPKAEQVITNYLYLAERTQNTTKILDGITNISIVYHNQGAYQKAISVLHKGQRMAPNAIHILTNLATNYVALGRIDKAKKIAQKTIQINATSYNAHQILAQIALKQQQFAEAKQQLLIAKTLYLQQPNATARGLVKWQLGYMDLLLRQGKYDLALQAIQEMYSTLLPKYTSAQLVPKQEALIVDQLLLKILDLNAHVYTKMNRLEEAIQVYELTFYTYDQLVMLYPLQDTKIQWQQQHRYRTEAYLAILYHLYSTTGQERYGATAFLASERSKAPIVSKALVTNQRLRHYKSDRMVQEKEKLVQDLARYETQIIREKQKGEQANITQLQQWETAHHIKTTALRVCVQKLQERYPELYVDTKLSITKLQQKLATEQTTLITYFYGKEQVYYFEIGSEHLKMKRITKDASFEKVLSTMIHAFDHPSAITNTIKTYTTAAFKAYQMLALPAEVQNMIIIPDGRLHFVPFEALLTARTSTIRFQDMPFLMANTVISYEISATKYANTIPAQHKKPNVLGVFPVFEGTALALPSSVKEQMAIAKQLGGTFLMKNNATYDQFVTHVQKSTPTILHVSTHATAGNFRTPATLQFYDQEIVVNQLYGLQLAANLIVLSACETGVGKVAKGEGPLSIGRGFQYAGIPNVMLSLWKVNDQTTATFMSYFYDHIARGYTIANAVQQAKLAYLEDDTIANVQKSPYHWAAFAYYGTPTQHFTTTISYFWYVSIGIGLGIIVFLLLLFRRKK